jgi:choice-of-anchor C domain-containing protein
MTPSDPLYGTEVTVPPGALDQTVTFSLSALTEGDLTTALAEGLSATDRFRGGITIQTNPTVSLELPLAVTLPSSGGARRRDQLLVGQILGLDPGHPPAFVYRGLAALGSLKFSMPTVGSYGVVSPASPLVIANGHFLTPSGAPVQDGIVRSTAYPLFTALTNQAGAFTLPAGQALEFTLLVARTATTTAGLGVLGTILLPANQPLEPGYFDVIAATLQVRKPEKLKPCKQPVEPFYIVSNDQPGLNGPFRLVEGGPAINTRLWNGKHFYGGGIPDGTATVFDTIHSDTGLAWLVDFATADPTTVARVEQNGDTLRGLGAGSTIESAHALIVKFEKVNKVLLPCRAEPVAFRPVVVQPALAIDSGRPPVGEVGVPYRATLTATGGWPGYTWKGSMPAGLELTPEFASAGERAEIAGIPREAGEFTVSVTVSDSNTPPTSTSAGISLKILPAVQITTTGLRDGTVGSPYSEPITFSGGQEPYHWRVKEGALPPGLALSPPNDPKKQNERVIDGTPTTPGTTTFTLEITDDLGAVDEQVLTLTVAPAPDPPPPPPPDPPPPDPSPPPPPSPPVSSGADWGEPRLRTIDGLTYDFQATGEFVLARSTTGGPTVHARFGTNSLWGPNLSVNRGLAVRDQTDLVTFSDAAGLPFDHSPPVRVNGALVDPATLPMTLPGGGRLDADDQFYRFTTSDGTVIEVTRAGYPAYIVTPAPALAGSLEGLLGNFDRDVDNDTPDDLYGAFADRWRVTAANSLFTTTQPSSELVPATPQPVRLSDFPTADVAAALETCRAAGVDPSTLEDCAIDLLITANPAAATGAAAVAGLAAGTVDHDLPPVTQRISSLVGQPVTTVVPANGTVEIVVPVGANRAFRLDPGPGCTPSPLIATVQAPGTSSTVSIDLGSCTDDRVLGTGPEGGQLVVTLRALGSDVPASVAVVYVPIQASAFANGSFEAPVVDAAFLTLQAGQTMGPWTVTAGEVDQLSTWATPQEGRQSVDLSGTVGGRICQSFTTSPGSTYAVSFWMSHNAVDVTSASLLASVTGITSTPFTHDAASTNTDPQWESHVFRFTAAASSSELCFESTDPAVGSGPSGGALLDNVTVTQEAA